MANVYETNWREDLSKSSWGPKEQMDYHKQKLKQELDLHDYMRNKAQQEHAGIINYYDRRHASAMDFYKDKIKYHSDHPYIAKMYEKDMADAERRHKESQADRLKRHQSNLAERDEMIKQTHKKYADIFNSIRGKMSGQDSQQQQSQRQQQGQQQQQSQRQQQGQQQQQKQQEAPRKQPSSEATHDFNFNAMPHEMLGVPHNAGRAEIMSAYKNKVREFHPDLKPDAPSHMKNFYTQATAHINNARDKMIRSLQKSLVKTIIETMNAKDELIKARWNRKG